MRRFVLTAAIFLLLLTSGLAFVYYGVPRFIKPELIRAQILSPLEKLSAGSLTYSGFEFSYFPRFKVTFLNVRLKGSGKRQLETRAARVQLEPDSFPLLIRQFRVKQMKVEGADIDLMAGPEDPWTSVQLKSVTAEALPLGTLKAMRIRTAGHFAGTGGSFEGDMRLTVKSFSDWDWLDTVLHGHLKAKSPDLKSLYASLGMKSGLVVEKGTGLAEIRLNKERGFNGIHSTGHLEGAGLVYSWMPPEQNQRIESPSMELSFDFESTVDPLTSEWSLRRSTFQFPPGKIELSGQGNYRSGEIQDLRFSAPEIQLEQIPNYFVMAREALPFNIGFSGLGRLEIAFKGTREKMNIYLNSDLAPALLTYGRFLDKPKGIPFLVVLDAVIENQRILNGDLSVRFNEVLAKGSVKNLNLDTGQGQINLITNKHPVANWGPLIPFLREFDLSGGMKILTNWEGDLHDLETVKKVFNLTIEKGSASEKNGASVKDVHVELDYDSAMGLVVKHLEFLLAKTPVRGQVSVYNTDKSAVVKTVLSSPDADLPEVLSALETLFLKAPQWQEKIKSLKEWLLLSNVSAVRGKNFVFEAEHKNGVWKVEKIGMDVGAGRLTVKGTVSTQNSQVDLTAHVELNKAGLHLLFPPADGKESVTGELFVNGDFKGQKMTAETLAGALEGSGSLLITKASFPTIDLFQALGQIPEFAALKQAAGSPAVFDDIRGHFSRKDGRFVSEDLVLLSPDFSIDAKGELLPDGQLNFRLALYLSQEQARKVLADSAEQMGLSEGEWFGPVPLIMTGTLAKPEIRSDPEAARNLLTRVQRGETQGAFRNFLREEVLFEDFNKN